MRKKLKDVCMFYSGTGFPIQYQGQTKGEYPFYKVGDIANNIWNYVIITFLQMWLK